MKKALLILNPHAGKRTARTNLFAVVDGLTRGGWEVTVYPTQEAGDAERIARERGGDFELLVCSGGDGTLSEAVSGVLRAGHSPAMSYIPAGTTNDFAASLHLSGRPGEALHAALSGVPCRLDAGKLTRAGLDGDDRYFTYLAAFGLLTHVSYTTPQEQKNTFGRAAYFLEGLKQLGTIQSYPMRVSAGEQSLEDSFILGFITNATSMAGLIRFDKENVLFDDGYFEVLLVRDPGSPAVLARIMLEVINQVYDKEYVRLFRADEITFEADGPVPWCLDGENGGEHQMAVIQNLKQAYTLMLPGGKIALSPSP